MSQIDSLTSVEISSNWANLKYGFYAFFAGFSLTLIFKQVLWVRVCVCVHHVNFENTSFLWFLWYFVGMKLLSRTRQWQTNRIFEGKRSKIIDIDCEARKKSVALYGEVEFLWTGDMAKKLGHGSDSLIEAIPGRRGKNGTWNNLKTYSFRFCKMCAKEI